jgi:thiamine-monophosphate kinase
MTELLTVQEIGEQGLLKRVQWFCPSAIVGDDAAVLPTESEKSLVVTTDVLVDGVHFSDRTTSPESAGWRAATANLSDLAAMGATPLGITVGLGLPAETSVDWVERLYQGMVDCLQRFETAIVGGDLCRSPVRTVSITAFGQVDPDCVIRRSLAQPGDAILVTGYHGSSCAGLELLLNPESGKGLEESDRAALIKAHQFPIPRLDILPIPTTRIAGMDSSDGLADAVIQICRMSGVGARLDRSAIPIHPALKRWVSAEQAINWALYGGEDFELVLCLPEELAQDWVKELGKGAAIVGEITSDRAVRLIDASGELSGLSLSLDQGFQHFS